jgi:hypothetical protein
MTQDPNVRVGHRIQAKPPCFPLFAQHVTPGNTTGWKTRYIVMKCCATVHMEVMLLQPSHPGISSQMVGQTQDAKRMKGYKVLPR